MGKQLSPTEDEIGIFCLWILLQTFFIMLTRAQKKKIVDDLSDKIKRQQSLIFTDVSRINVSGAQRLRRTLRQSGIEYKVAKKSLINLALKKDPIRQKLSNGVNISQFTGTIGLAFSYNDPIVPIKILDKFAKEHENFKILAGIMGNKILTIDDIKQLAKISSKEELLAMLVSSLKAPINGLINVLGGTIRNLVGVLNAIVNK